MSWSYRTGEVTQRVIPAAKDGADFQHGDNDETVKSRGDGVGTPESGKELWSKVVYESLRGGVS